MAAERTIPSEEVTRRRWETAWLRLIVRGDPEAETLREASALAGEGGAWQLLIERVNRESLLPHAAALFEVLPNGSLPGDVAGEVREQLRMHCAHSVLAVLQLKRIMSALAEAGVEALTFKGPALGAVAFGDPMARAYVDVDVLVRRSQRHRAGSVLERLGYTPQWPIAPGAGSFLRHSSAVLLEQDGSLDLDLHWGFSTPLMPFELVRSGLWARTRAADLQSCSVTTLGAEDSLLHACVHAARDDWIYWRAYADVAALLRHAQTLDWSRLLQLARRTGTSRLLRIGLLLAQNVGRVRLPERISAWTRRDARAVALALAFQADLESGRPAPQGVRHRLRRTFEQRERLEDCVLSFVGAVTRASEPRAGEAWAAWTWPVRRPLRLWRDLRGEERAPLGGYSP